MTRDKPAAAKTTASRITGAPVPPRFPDAGPVRVLCIGEAPGPRGADKSGVPFFGDRAGGPLYRALVLANACTMPPQVSALPWDGAVFAEQKLVPELRAVALGNAFDSCPTDDGRKFRAPSRAELESSHNLERLARDIDKAAERGLTLIVALGRVAARTAELLLERHPDRWPGVTLHITPHPSAQGLLSAAPDRGRGARLADLAAAWEQDLARVITSATESA